MNLDLVEVSPASRPPVCRILDYGKFKYEQSKKEKQAKKRQHSIQMKEMRYRPKIDEHDYQFKLRHVREFLMAGSKVRTFVMFRGRELAYTEYGKDLLDRLALDLQDIALIDSPAKREGRHMSMILGPKPEILRNLKVTTRKPAKVAAASETAAREEPEEDLEDLEELEDLENAEEAMTELPGETES